MYLKIVLLLLTVVNFSLVFSKRPLTANSLWKYSVKVIFKFWEKKTICLIGPNYAKFKQIKKKKYGVKKKLKESHPIYLIILNTVELNVVYYGFSYSIRCVILSKYS